MFENRRMHDHAVYHMNAKNLTAEIQLVDHFSAD